MRRTVEQLRQSRQAQSESGQAMVEFALTITLTLLLIFAVIDFSRAIYTASIIQWAAQYGARAAIIMDPSQDDFYDVVVAAVKERLIGLDPEEVEVAVPTWTGNVVQVQVTYPFEFLFPLVQQITGDGIDMNSSASMIAH